MMLVSAETRRIWAVPTLIALATLVALIGALITEGFWDILATLLLFSAPAYATALGLRTVDHRK